VAEDDPMSILIRLYAHENEAVQLLEQVRVNPDFTSRFRNDLEFFIPQICSFYLKGDQELMGDLVNLILNASTSSFFYSHRILFFFQAMLFPDTDTTHLQQFYKRGVIYRRLKAACISTKERLYLQNSGDIVKLITELDLIDKYPWLKEMLP
jgi:hypothetical protein